MNKLFLLPFLCVSLYSQSFDALKTHLIEEEGRYNAAYYDSLGNKTIGIGHKVLPNESLIYISDKELDELFEEDVSKAIASAKTLIPTFDKQSENAKIVIVSMVFNLGHSGFFKFKNFREALSRRDYNAAAVQLENSLWAKQVPKRAARAAILIKKK